MALEFRSPAEDELRATFEAGVTAFAEELEDRDFERERRSLPLDRIVAAYDDSRPVGLAGSYPFELTIPGAQVPAAGVTWVAVLPSHRRRGLLREFMTRQLRDLRERGEPVAILWASESSIYGRFGYGIASLNHSIRAERDRLRFREDAGPEAAVRLVTADEALPLVADVYERIRHTRPGMFARGEHWWKEHALADPERSRRGASPKYVAVAELDGRAEAYAMYRVAQDWEHGVPRSELRVVEALGTTPTATREIWRFLFGVDLVAHVRHEWFDPTGLLLAVVEPRRLHVTQSDGLWLRLVDVDAALRARAYAGEGSVVVDVRDDLCQWNVGRYRIGEDAGRSDADPELRLDVADLGSTYLGGFDFHALAFAGRVEELVPGALERASALVRTPLPPYCPEEF